ncbi:MAG: cation:proton antiporter [Campylobacterota bacterium]|nr:cation:proton antiporter [Campylobacterota bacterium]
MDSTLYYALSALAISVVLNLILKRFGISQIIGYILTGTIIAYSFDISHAADNHTLELISEFGIVFLMFTIGLEMSVGKIKSMKMAIFGNGLMQVGFTSIIVYAISFYLFNLSIQTSLIIALSFSMSSTAVVLTYLKTSKEIYTPYGQRSTGILIFQDIAVIPVLLLIGFLSSDGVEISQILLDTAISAIVIIALLFSVGKYIINWLLHFSADSNIEEFFIGSILVIVMGASLFAHHMGFTYSLGAFLAGMLISETKYIHKVESDIAAFKNLLLGIFFVVVGMKIDLAYFTQHFLEIIAILVAILILKSIVIFSVIRVTSNRLTSLKTALALSQVGEFSFAIFALASSSHLIGDNISNMLVLVVVISMIITPFIISNIGKITSFCSLDDIDNDISSENIELKQSKNHIIVCGYGVVGKFVTRDLRMHNANCVVVDNSLKHVQQGLEQNEQIFYGDMSKIEVLHALHVEDAAAIIVTLDNMDKKRLICETIVKYSKHINLIVKVVSLEEKELLSDLPLSVVVDGKEEVAKVLVEHTLQCKLECKI